jgi:hypothetical protein
MSNNPIVLFHILAKDKEKILDYWLEQNLDKINYPKERIILFFRTNNNNDNTRDIINEWIEKQKKNNVNWREIIFDDTDVPEKVEEFGVHEWNTLRFSVLARLRQEGITKSKTLNVDFYFVCDVDNFLLPETLTTLVATNVYIIAPLLKNSDIKNSNYSNFHHPVTKNGYFMQSDIYYEILSRKNPSLHNVDLVHCTYLIRKDIFDKISYSDDTKDYEYVIFSRNLRLQNIQHLLDTRKIYGCLTLNEDVETCKKFMINL